MSLWGGLLFFCPHRVQCWTGAEVPHHGLVPLIPLWVSLSTKISSSSFLWPTVSYYMNRCHVSQPDHHCVCVCVWHDNTNCCKCGRIFSVCCHEMNSQVCISRAIQSLNFEYNCWCCLFSDCNYTLGYLRFVAVRNFSSGAGWFGAAPVSLLEIRDCDSRGSERVGGSQFQNREAKALLLLLGNYQLIWFILVWWPQDCICAFCQWCGFIASLDHDLQLGWFAADGEVVGIRVSTSRVRGALPDNGGLLPAGREWVAATSSSVLRSFLSGVGCMRLTGRTVMKRALSECEALNSTRLFQFSPLVMSSGYEITETSD